MHCRCFGTVPYPGSNTHRPPNMVERKFCFRQVPLVRALSAVGRRKCSAIRFSKASDHAASLAVLFFGAHADLLSYCFDVLSQFPPTHPPAASEIGRRPGGPCKLRRTI